MRFNTEVLIIVHTDRVAGGVDGNLPFLDARRTQETAAR